MQVTTGGPRFTLGYFKTGALSDDGENYKYVWDAFGRLKEVLDRSDDSLVAEYTYNGLGFRITEHHDTDVDGDVDVNDATYHFVYDERWRIVATYRNDDANPKEQFVHHAAGAGGYGSSSYIDAVILRDADLSTAWNAQADALDTRHYYCQNWRADVSVIIDDTAVLVERVMYSPYGVPFGIPAGDLVSSGGSEPADGGVRGADLSALTGTYWGSSNNIADLDNDGDVDSADQTLQSNNNGATLGWGALSLNHNRLGYAGYVFDEALAGTKWHVRHRVLESVLGRWISRDPLDQSDALSMYVYVHCRPVAEADSLGLFGTSAPSNSYAEFRCRSIPWFPLAQHCFVRCCDQYAGCQVYSLMPEGEDACIRIRRPGHPDNPHGPPEGRVYSRASAQDLCACFRLSIRRTHRNNNGDPCFPSYRIWSCNSNWFANSLWECCTGERTAAPWNAPWGLSRDCCRCNAQGNRTCPFVCAADPSRNFCCSGASPGPLN